MNAKELRKSPLRHYPKLPAECLICGGYAEWRAVIALMDGGREEFWNHVPLCRPHFREMAEFGFYRFTYHYPIVKMCLQFVGWQFHDMQGNPRLSHDGLIPVRKKSFSVGTRFKW